MKKTGYLLLIALSLAACRDKGIPDVSNIRIELTVRRFEKDFFAMDTTRLLPSLQQLTQKYPGFVPDFAQHILGLPPVPDSSTQALLMTRQFLKDYTPVKDSADKLFARFDKYEKEIKQGLQFVKYYFPSYPLPGSLITFIGPIDAYAEASLGGYGDVITKDGLAVGLQLHMGKDYSIYKSQMGQSLYPEYISRRFTPDYITVNCMKNIIDDIYPEKKGSRTLIEQMVEKGKRLYLLEKFMPYTPDSIRIGYTDYQLKGCYKNEGRIWNFFLTNSLLLNSEPALTKEYVSDGPNTQAIGEGSPGNIGLFVGQQIVKKYLSKNPSLSLQELLQTDAKKIYEESRYKPG